MSKPLYESLGHEVASLVTFRFRFFALSLTVRYKSKVTYSRILQIHWVDLKVKDYTSKNENCID